MHTLLIHYFVMFLLIVISDSGDCSQTDPYLNIGTNHVSWWARNGIGCEPATVNITTSAEYSSGCFLAFYYVEVIHAGVQCLLGVCRKVSFFLAEMQVIVLH